MPSDIQIRGRERDAGAASYPRVKASDKKASFEGSAKEPPLCLNKSKVSNQKHWMSNCPNSTEEEKKTLLDAYKSSKALGEV
jgi:hypothetical protein